MTVSTSATDSIDEYDGPYLVLTKSLAKFANPYQHNIWGAGIIKKKDIKAALEEGRLDGRRNTVDIRTTLDDWKNDDLHYNYDVERIAYLVVHKSDWPIDIDVYNGITIEDGFHRLAAAIYRGDEYIAVNYGGDVEEFHTTFRKKVLIKS